MFGFPINLQDSGVQKFTNDADSGFPKIQQREVFYSVKNGQWSDVSIWQTASGRVGKLPTINDDVYIRHTVSVNPFSTPTQSINVNNFIVTESGKVNDGPSSGYEVRVYGDFKCYGVYDSVATGNWRLYGLNNYIDKSKQVTNININYERVGDQPIMDANYNVLTTSNIGLKYTTSDLIVNTITSTNNLYVKNPHSFTCNGVFNVHFFYSDTEHNLTFKGTASSLYMFFCTRNPTIEFQNNIAFNQGNFATTAYILPFPYGSYQSIYLGTGLVKFTTNNITINNTGTAYFDNNFLIDPNIVVTNNTGSNMYVHGTWNGSNGASQLINKGSIYFNSLASVPSMTTGIWDFTTNANTIGYTGNYTATIPSYFTTFHNLTISGTGTKSLGVNTMLNGNLVISSNGNLQLSTYDLVVTGTSTLSGTGVRYPLEKSGSGNVTFVGLISTGNNQPTLNFSGGNPNVNVRGGISSISHSSRTQFNSGTGTWTFDTNNQTIDCPFGVGSTLFFDGQVLIGSGITLTIGSNIYPSTIALNNILGINGISGTSTLLNNINGNIRLDVNCTLMSTGIFNIPSVSTSTLYYNFAGNYTLPYTTFANLRIGNSGVKTLSGNTTMQNLFMTDTINGAVLECSTFNLTINGTTTLTNKLTDPSYYILRKSGSGNILFNGLLSLSTSSSRLIDFSGGNPSVELRGGIEYYSNLVTTLIKSGSGTWSFTTNNQSLTQVFGTGTLQFDCPILISGAITLTQVNTSTLASTLIFTGTINGNNANSKYLMGTASGTNTLNYQSPTQPMATGILDTSTNLNTWIYGLNNQDIKGSPTISPKQVYRNLTLNGTGVKRLTGYVSVLNTYTLTAPATLDNNGFTLTNP